MEASKVTQRVLVELGVWNWAKGVGGRSEPDITMPDSETHFAGSLCDAVRPAHSAPLLWTPFRAQVSASQTESGGFSPPPLSPQVGK